MKEMKVYIRTEKINGRKNKNELKWIDKKYKKRDYRKNEWKHRLNEQVTEQMTV